MIIASGEQVMDDQKEYWDSVATSKNFTLPLEASLLDGLIDNDSSVLDFGCGYGRILMEMQDAGYRHLEGVDFSSGMIERGRKAHPGLNLRLVTDSGDLEPGAYNLIILFAVLTCVAGNGGQSTLIADLEKSLKPGGFLYISDFLLNDDQRNLQRYQKFVDRFENYGTFELPDGGIVRHHAKPWLDTLWANFQEVEYRETLWTTMNGNTSKGFRYVGRKLTRPLQK